MSVDEMTHQQYADSLRKLADFWEANPDIELPHDADRVNYFSAHSREDVTRLARAFREVGGRTEKFYDQAYSNSFELEHHFGGIAFRVIADREKVCEAVVVGKRHVEAQVIPARAIEVIPARDEDIIEWRCDSALLEPSAPIDIDSPLGQVIRHEQTNEQANQIDKLLENREVLLD